MRLFQLNFSLFANLAVSYLVFQGTAYLILAYMTFLLALDCRAARPEAHGAFGGKNKVSRLTAFSYSTPQLSTICIN